MQRHNAAGLDDKSAGAQLTISDTDFRIEIDRSDNGVRYSDRHCWSIGQRVAANLSSGTLTRKRWSSKCHGSKKGGGGPFYIWEDHNDASYIMVMFSSGLRD